MMRTRPVCWMCVVMTAAAALSSVRMTDAYRDMGIPCQEDFQCGSGLYCDVSVSDDGSVTVAGIGVCGGLVSVDGICTDHNQCDSGRCMVSSSTTSTSTSTSSRVCGGVLDNDSTCSIHEDCASGLCASTTTNTNNDYGYEALYGTNVVAPTSTSTSSLSGTCRSKFARNSDCNDNVECSTNRCQGGDPTCTFLMQDQNNTNCETDSDCTNNRCKFNPGLSLVVVNPLYCEARVYNDRKCDIDDDCYSLRCSNYICQEPFFPGSPCEEDTDCYYQYCDLFTQLCGSQSEALEVGAEPFQTGTYEDAFTDTDDFQNPFAKDAPTEGTVVNTEADGDGFLTLRNIIILCAIVLILCGGCCVFYLMWKTLMGDDDDDDDDDNYDHDHDHDEND